MRKDIITPIERILIPRVDPVKAEAFRQFKPGEYVSGEGYKYFDLMAITVDEVTLDTVAYFDLVTRHEYSSSRILVTGFRYEIVDGVFVQVFRSRPSEIRKDAYEAARRKARNAMKEPMVYVAP